MMVQLLARTTELEVREVEDGTIPLPNRIYITPPNRNLILENERFQLVEPGIEVLPKPSVNTFLHSLAESRGEDAIAVILSGTGSDGASGARAIKAGGGLVFAQDPLSAKYSGMPQATIDTGCADWVLSPPEIANEISLIVRNRGSILHSEPPSASPTTLKALLYKVQRHTQVDFSGYKEATVWRRILRRMAANRVHDMDEYLILAERNPEEYNQLCKEILISVTAFFRDPLAFDALKGALGELLESKSPRDEIRIWVPGCATGEEAYTIAIVLFELLGDKRNERKIQIFATDLDLAAMANARRGLYAESSLSAMSTELISRYFHPQGDSYEVIKPLREAVVFARQNVLQDPPFLRLDLISCRLPQSADLLPEQPAGKSPRHLPLRAFPRWPAVPGQIGKRLSARGAFRADRSPAQTLPPQGADHRRPGFRATQRGPVGDQPRPGQAAAHGGRTLCRRGLRGLRAAQRHGECPTRRTARFRRRQSVSQDPDRAR